jgi:hypothetical protein
MLQVYSIDDLSFIFPFLSVRIYLKVMVMGGDIGGVSVRSESESSSIGSLVFGVSGVSVEREGMSDSLARDGFGVGLWRVEWRGGKHNGPWGLP